MKSLPVKSLCLNSWVWLIFRHQQQVENGKAGLYRTVLSLPMATGLKSASDGVCCV